MTYTQLNKDWNAEPNDPQVFLLVDQYSVIIEFYLNSFQFNNFQEGDKARLTFFNCHKYSFNTMNDEGYFMNKYRYTNEELPWGKFYKLNNDWSADFPIKYETLISQPNSDKLSHYLFFSKTIHLNV
ncbi:hypothetical protein [Flavisolibacter tropicus]|uniref:Uncharacterized protein n=1 Tax=Flavisolibacter tropicus TaxID=1492898 RepID=A0A172TYL3_9BACT|nr:hypothetical protein [Flavisolibacter tropicus]ANE52179.1 hypothetical protein SY85_18450 [Flavisolibacter tropicus]